MINFRRLFKTQIDLYLDTNQELDVRIIPLQLIKRLNPRNPNNDLKNFTKKIKKQTKNGAKILRLLTVLHLLLFYSNDFACIIQQIFPIQNLCQDKWFNQYVLQPYSIFLQKCCHSYQYYKEIKGGFKVQVSFQKVFYLINLINQLTKCVSKMPSLGRYYKNSNKFVLQSFIQMIAVQGQRIYGDFKSIITLMLQNPQKYISNIENQQLIKNIISQSLPLINQQMKKLFLDKYFYPYGKGIGIKLFKIQQQNQQLNKIINGILKNHQDTQRKQYQQELQNSIFTNDGKVNIQFYQKSLMNTFIINQQYQQEILDDQCQPGKGFQDTTCRNYQDNINQNVQDI